jgi:hypothetical protein
MPDYRTLYEELVGEQDVARNRGTQQAQFFMVGADARVDEIRSSIRQTPNQQIFIPANVKRPEKRFLFTLYSGPSLAIPREAGRKTT